MRATDIDLDLAKKLWAEGKTDIQLVFLWVRCGHTSVNSG